MSGTDIDHGGQSAESALEHLLRPWHAGPADQPASAGMPAGGLAFLPVIRHEMARRPLVKMAAARSERIGDRPASVEGADRNLDPSAPAMAAPSIPSFEDVSNAIANRISSVPIRPVSGDDELAADAQHFAARIGALEAARLLDESACGDPPTPDGCFERYRGIVDDLEDETEEDQGLAADLSAMFNPNLMAFDNDGEAAEASGAKPPRRSEPVARGALRTLAAEDELGAPPAKAIFL